MRAVLKAAPEPGALFTTEYPEPEPGPGEVKIRVEAVSICGTDREMHDWTPAAVAFKTKTPVVLGHEASGTITALGADVEGFAIGDRVALESHLPCGECAACLSGSAHVCGRTEILAMHFDGAFAEYAVVPARICFALPAGMSAETGALLEPAGVAWHAIQRADGLAGVTSVLVSGCGPIGLLIVQFARELGIADVLAVEPNAFRRAWAEKLGAIVFADSAAALAYAREHLTGGGVDAAFEASGVGTAYEHLFEAVRLDGTVVTIGHPGHPQSIDIAAHINKRGITLRGVFGRRIWDTWEGLAKLLDGGVDLDWIISHRLPLERFDEAIALLGAEANKVLILPQLAVGEED
jgi:threonine 3-dehydrogenase